MMKPEERARKNLEIAEAILDAYKLKAKQEVANLAARFSSDSITLADVKEKVEFTCSVLETLEDSVKHYADKVQLFETVGR